MINTYANLLIEEDDGIAVITINRPNALNALNRSVYTELDSVLDKISKSSSVKVVILTGSGSKAFVSGGDIKAMSTMTPLEARDFAKQGQVVFAKIETLPQPVIAAINGYALGGGCELAMACDIRIASEKAVMGQPEVTVGISLAAGGSVRLARLVGPSRAKELIFTGDAIDSAEAYRIGLVNKVVAHEDVLNTAKTMARKIMSRAPVAVLLSKAAINTGLDVDYTSGMAYEAEVFSLCFSTEDQKEGMLAFNEKRKPVFRGR